MKYNYNNKGNGNGIGNQNKIEEQVKQRFRTKYEGIDEIEKGRETQVFKGGLGGKEAEQYGLGDEKYQEKSGARSEVYAFRLRSKKETAGCVPRSQNAEMFFENLTWLTSNEAAVYLRLPSVGALRWLVFNRKIPFHKLGRSLRFKKNDLDRLLESSKKGGMKYGGL